MPKRQPLDNEALTALCRYLVRRVDSLTAQLETALLLLQHREVFSDDEFSQLLAQVEADRLKNSQTAVSKAADAVRSDTILRILEDVEGTKH